MRVVTWNVRELGGSLFRKKRGRIRQDLQKCLLGGAIDVLMLQEHHLSIDRA